MKLLWPKLKQSQRKALTPTPGAKTLRKDRHINPMMNAFLYEDTHEETTEAEATSEALGEKTATTTMVVAKEIDVCMAITPTTEAKEMPMAAPLVVPEKVEAKDNSPKQDIIPKNNEGEKAVEAKRAK
jgi:hypothetical protein